MSECVVMMNMPKGCGSCPIANFGYCSINHKQVGDPFMGYPENRPASCPIINELEAQLPKRGEWIKHPEVKNIYGGVYIECPFCGEKYVVQNVSDEKFCRNCGADMRAKMEVQE